MTLETLKLKALSDVGSYKTNTKLTKPGNVAKYYRDVANDGADRPIALSNDAINGIVLSVEGNDEDAQDERVRLLLKADGQTPDADEPAEPSEPDDEPSEPSDTDEPDTGDEPKREIQVEAANAVEREAATLIADTLNDDAFNSTMAAGIAADKELKMAPLNLRSALLAKYGEKLNAFPVPGTKRGDKACGNNPPDMRRTMVKKKDGGFREKFVSSINAMFDSTKEGRSLHTIVKTVLEANDPNRKAGNPYAKRSKYDRSQDLADAKSSITTGRGMLRKAIALHLHLFRCDGLPDVQVYYREQPIDAADKSKGNKPRSTRYPIVVKNKVNEEEINFYSITQFLGLDPDEARNPDKIKEHGSVWAALCASGGRGAGDNNNKTSRIQTREEAEGYLAEIAAWCGQKEAGTLLNKWMAEKDARQLRLSIDGIVSELTIIRDGFAKQIATDKTVKEDVADAA